jgi:hypothetical protein
MDTDLEKFFDRVNHDVPMARVVRKVTDKRALGLIRAWLFLARKIEGMEAINKRWTLLWARRLPAIRQVGPPTVVCPDRKTAT